MLQHDLDSLACEVLHRGAGLVESCGIIVATKPTVLPRRHVQAAGVCGVKEHPIRQCHCGLPQSRGLLRRKGDFQCNVCTETTRALSLTPPGSDLRYILDCGVE